VSDPRLISRIALFSALVYVLSWGTSYFPNLNFVFFIVFTSGFLWGAGPGALVGLVGMGLWTVFNPYGPAPFPIMVAQLVGAASAGPVGSSFVRFPWQAMSERRLVASLVVCAVACTLLFYLPVNLIDSWLFRPFWPRFITGLLWMMISLVSNAIIFPLLFKVTRLLYLREARA